MAADLLKVTLLHECFSRFLNFTSGTISRSASQGELTLLEKKSQWLFKAHYSVISAMYNFMKQREAFLYFLRRDRHRYFILFVSF